ncbi:rhamnulokinase family protein [Bacteroides sp. 519]|uniref:rhamnulokinase n=1 Tax=Bacteroides sp. 519 TaxID=2302937 RepID=UPI0013D2F9D4|nr:rhamnulokinase family protein [Bacteroides sp. 519]NDV58050.1 rhamnulokinase [Bacteroides sp. 519]
MKTYLAIDFGGGSGRVIAGTISDGMVELEEIHRFTNRQIKAGKHVYWDFLSLFEEMKTGLRIAAQKGYDVNGIGIDTWGVDYGLIDKAGNLIGNPVCYRDSRTDGMPEDVFRLIDKSEHYSETGIQVMSINTLFQLYSQVKASDPQIQIADKLLFMPDLFSYYLTGVANNEYCIASTSELLNARKKTWATDLIDKLGLPQQLFGDIIQPGTIRGKLKKEISAETGLAEVDVIAVGSHDTASAIIAIPTLEKDSAFLSSGTWSLLGAEVDEPILTKEAEKNGFTNEGGVGEKVRFLQNITGLWILQRLMNEWSAKGESVNYDQIIEEAKQVKPQTIIFVDDSCFQNPDNMEKAIQDYCERNNKKKPITRGEVVRCVLESLAYRYKQGIDCLNQCLEQPVKQLNIIGGGCRNKLLNQLTANYLGIPVYAGPVEATAMGNILVQAWAKKEIASLDELKEIVIKSVQPQVYYPELNK